jgi:hypothetical protein
MRLRCLHENDFAPIDNQLPFYSARSSAEGDYALFQESTTATLPGDIVRALPFHFSRAKRYPIVKDHAPQTESARNFTEK